MTSAALLFGLLCSHAICDYAWQSDSMAKGKNRHHKTTPPPGAVYQPTWYFWLSAHALVHGAGVAVVTGQWWLGFAEAICHWLIDFGKCENKYGIKTDQSLHLLCKLVWFLAVIFS